jgi:hypothetical protein
VAEDLVEQPVTPSPVPVQDTIGPYLDFEPSALTLVLAGVSVIAIVLYVTQVLRMPKGTFWKRNFRFEPFVDARLGIGSMIMMIASVAAVCVAHLADQRAHDAAVEAQRAHEAAVQVEIKSALADYYGVEFLDEHAWIYSHLPSTYDDLPGDSFRVRLPDGSEREDCYVGTVDGFYVMSCGPADAPAVLPPVGGATSA